MSGGRMLSRQVAYTNKAFWRNPASAFFTFAFPLMFLVIFTSIFGDVIVHPVAGRVDSSTFYIPAIVTFSVITACYTNIAISVTFLRDLGVLKRIHGTPMPAWSYLASRIVHAVLIAILLVAIVAVFGLVLYDAEIPARTFPAFVVTVMVGASVFCALGLAVTAIIPNADAAPAVVNALILPLLFISDVFIPIQDPNAWYVTVAKVFPVKHFSDAMLNAYFAPRGTGFQVRDLLIMGAWGLAGLVLAAKFFSWEPRR